MPSRLRYNNQGGTLGAALSSSATAITFAAAPGFSTVQSGDHVPLLLEPPQGATPSANFEIAWLTAYTAGQTTGTIVRGREGTSGVAHASGVAWAHAPTAWDAIFGKGADTPQAGDLGYDYEFLTPGSSLPSGWSWNTQGAGVTYAEYLKGGVIYAPAGVMGAVQRSCPAAPWTLSAKLKRVAGHQDQYTSASIFFADAANHIVQLQFGNNQGAAADCVILQYFNGWNSWVTNQGQIIDLGQRLFGELYLQIAFRSLTSADYSISQDGQTWVPLWTNMNATAALGAFGTPTVFGFACSAPPGGPAAATCEWFRCR